MKIFNTLLYCGALIGTLLAVSTSNVEASSSEATILNDYQVYKINTPHPMEPSGLTLKSGQLYTVCDDINSIFKLKISDDKNASAEVEKQIDSSSLQAMALDLEGITVVGDEFFLVSEAHHKFIRSHNSKPLWVPELGSVYADANVAGLFQIYNAGIEAATYLGDQTFLMAVEREPRGLIEVTFDSNFTKIIKQTNQLLDSSRYPMIANRAADLTGLYTHQGMVFALHRNAYIINELIKNDDGLYQEGRAWSYEHIVKDPEFIYQDMQFGHAEGLAVDDDYFYLVIDNNNIGNLNNPSDKRPLLIKAKRPQT